MASEKTTKTEKLFQYLEHFPDCCYSYFMGNRATNSMNTKLSYANDLKLFFDYLIMDHPHFCLMKSPKEIQNKDFEVITPADIDRFVSKFIKSEEQDPRRRSLRTAARKRACVSTFFDYLYNSQGIISKNPVDGAAKIRVPERNYVVHLSVEEQWQLLNTVKYGTGLSPRQLSYHPHYAVRDFTIISLALDTGMRVSEIAGISLYDLDMKECSILITRKGSKIEKVFFSDAQKDILQEYLDQKQSYFPFNGTAEPLFTTLKGDRLSIRQIQALFKKYLEAALPQRLDTKDGFGFHRLRASFAMYYYRTTTDLLSLQKILGHSRITATNIYAKATEETVRNARNISVLERPSQ